MNFAACVLRIVRTWNIQIVANLFLALLITICLAGCGDQVRLPSAEQLAEFESAGPIRPTVDLNRLVRARRDGGLYRVVLGDVLELTMPTILQVVTAERLELPERVSPFTPYLCRVGESGSITLPIVGQIEVAGKSLAEIESAIIDAYHPKYIGDRPSVLARVAEYKMATISISGAVTKPGVYELRSDRMSLVALLMEADGIVDEGAALIHIIHPQEALTSDEQRQAETLEETIEEPVDHDKTETQVSTAQNAEPNEAKLQLSFAQMAPRSTVGQFFIKYDGRVLFAENLDVTSEIQRRALLAKMAEKGLRTSTIAAFEQMLCGLAERLEPGSGTCSSESQIALADAELNASDSKKNSKSDHIPEEERLEASDLQKDLEFAKNTPSGDVQEDKPLVLPVKGLNIPFADVALQDGDTVIVERLELPLVTVVGLVNKQGNFPYPPDTQYNLMQALGFAGGLDQAVEPRYATVYRLKPDGEVVHATFAFRDKSGLTAASNVLIKPGDIVDIEHTPRTRTKAFLDKVFRINLGVYAPLQLFGTNR